MTDHLPEVRRLLAAKHSDTHIATVLGVTRHRARMLINEVQAGVQVPAIIPASGLPALSFYDTARQALAQAKTLSEVKDIVDRGAAVREFARRAKDQTLKADAQEIIWRSERRLGEMLIEIKKTTGFAPAGRPPKEEIGSESEPIIRPATLADAGVDKKLSSRAQKLASISERAIEARIASHREEALSEKGRLSADLLKPMPSRSMNRVEAADSLDPFFTPPWATRALMDRVMPELQQFVWPDRRIWEPACGEGHISRVLAEYSRDVFASDIHFYGRNNIVDFFTAEAESNYYDWIITNPPFRGDMAERFVLRALDLAGTGVAMFVALQFLETVGRYNRIFKDRPPTLISFFSERVNCCKGRWDPDGSTDAAYIWLVWMKDRAPMPPFWIPPGQREALTKEDDRARFAAWSMPHDPVTGEAGEAAE